VTTLSEKKPEPMPFMFYGRSVRYDWAGVEHLLGKQTDRSIAKQLGCHVIAVANVRKLLDIPRFRKADEIRPLLGCYTDRVVAEMVGASRSTVTRQRLAEGIPKCNRARAVRLQRARRAAEEEEST
jgi:AraC-like DNA-binding protein